MVALSNLWKRGTDFLGCEYAILGGAMSWVSERNLVAAISSAGGFGVIACGSMTPDLLKAEIQATKNLTNKNFGVNLITMHPMIEQLIDVCVECGVKYVVLAGGLPASKDIAKLKEHNIKVICFAPALTLAKRLIKNGVDALIIEGNEAGGHIGPVATSVLAQEILPFITEVPVFVAGGIARGETMVNYLNMGAAGCQFGTRFVCAHESIAHQKFKQIFIKANARDAVASVQVDEEFSVIPVRAINNAATKDFIKIQQEAIAEYRSGKIDKNAAQLKIEHYWAGALKRAVIDGDVERGSVMAGQSVGMVTKEESVQEIIDSLILQAESYINKNI
jgi:enoyl-[acyl-carrier protein] reductase II